MAISDVLLEGGGSYLRHISTRGEGGLKSEDFSGDLTYGWPLSVRYRTSFKISLSNPEYHLPKNVKNVFKYLRKSSISLLNQ